MSPLRLRQVMVAVLAALLGIGIVAVYSSSAMAAQASFGDSLRFLKHHLAAIVIGLAAAVGCLAVPYPFWRRAAPWLFAISVIALVAVALIGPEVGGAKRWFRIGRMSFQPSEFVQLALIIYLADALARRSDRIQDFWKGVVPPLAATGLMAGLVLLQPDLGTATAMGAVALLLLVVARAKWQHLVLVVVGAVLLLGLLILGAEYRRRRFLAFLDPWQDPQGIGYQILQSYFALASGGLLGQGVGASLQKLFYLPSAHTDFIFAIIGEELGLAGTTTVIGLLGIFLACGMRIAMATQDLFSKYLVCGLVGMIGLEGIINIAVVTGMMPTKGLPLPMISYGGTSMIINLIACALIVQASRHASTWHGSAE